MTPKTTTANLLVWAGALALAILLSFLSGIATHWPEGGGIDWRGVVLDVVQTILTTAPLVAAGLGLPRVGKEAMAALVSNVGAPAAKAALEDEADRQAGVQTTGLSAFTLTDAEIVRIKRALHSTDEPQVRVTSGGSTWAVQPSTWNPPEVPPHG